MDPSGNPLSTMKNRAPLTLEEDVTLMLKVNDMLRTTNFKNARILAGANGLNREVKWVHIVEITQIGHLLHGNEVILTTGIGWADDEEKSLAYLQQLLDHNVSALCIELVVYVKKLPQKMLEIAEEHDFPIIGFMSEVRFIDITKDVHKLLIGQREHEWQEIEKLQQKLYNKLLNNGNIGDLLRILHKDTNKQLILRYNNQYRFFPSPPTEQQHKIIKEVESNDKQSYTKKEIKLFDKSIATLILFENKTNTTHYDQMALNKGGDILTQFFWKHQVDKETKLLKKK